MEPNGMAPLPAQPVPENPNGAGNATNNVTTQPIVCGSRCELGQRRRVLHPDHPPLIKLCNIGRIGKG